VRSGRLGRQAIRCGGQAIRFSEWGEKSVPVIVRLLDTSAPPPYVALLRRAFQIFLIALPIILNSSAVKVSVLALLHQ